ncbi:MAG TPA: MerR family transcriptional regulator [Pyrinomonadaceae bacterium]|nr:MerR family transcriptional regulator [Pyrinomonadaceae bacterium]
MAAASCRFSPADTLETVQLKVSVWELSEASAGKGFRQTMNRAAVYIPEKLFFKIGEVCDITGVQAHVLRYWESEFPMLAPQKNRAGQRTYRKRDVEMVLRIKELLYEDQYTIAGAKKKLVSEIRGASKLKVVTPDMNASSIAATEETPKDTNIREAAQQQQLPPPALAVPSYASDEEVAPTEPATPLTDERRAALRRLREQMRELLSLLDASERKSDPPRHH